MLQILQRAIDEHGLLRGIEHLLVAVSGGADSMGLLHGLVRLRRRYRLRLTVGHLDHRLRGGESAADARFVAEQAAGLGLDVVCEASDVRDLATRRRWSLEEAAREARYAFLARTCRAVAADGVATGHTRDDQAETVLMMLIRGAGPRGIRGVDRLSMRWGVRVIRPLLECGRDDILRFLRAEGLAWRDDASNRDERFLRNRVRHEILPLLIRRGNPGVVDVLVRTADVFGEEDAWLQRLAAERLVRCRDPKANGGLRVPLLRNEPQALRRRIVRQWLQEEDVGAARLDFALIERVVKLLDSESGTKRVPLGIGSWVERRYDRLIIERGRSAGDDIDVPVPLPGVVCDQGWRIETRWDAGFRRPSGQQVGVLPAEGWIRRDKILAGALSVRNWRRGDVIRPLGLSGSIKLQDVFVNAKVPRALRDRVPLLVCGDEVVWVPGYRVARGWEVPDADAPSLHIRVSTAGPSS